MEKVNGNSNILQYLKDGTYPKSADKNRSEERRVGKECW